MSDAAFSGLLQAWFGNLARVLEPGRSFYLWGGYANCGNYPPALKANGLYFSQAIIWVKEHPVLTRKVVVAKVLLQKTIGLMTNVRREESHHPWGSALPDKPARKPRRRGNEAVSNIHPLAFPIRDSALFWKECLKDGTSWSLRAGWVGSGIIKLLVPICLYRIFSLIVPQFPSSDFGRLTYTVSYQQSAFLALACGCGLLAFWRFRKTDHAYL